MKVACVVALLALASYTEAFSDGAPSSACKDMIPRHPVDPQKSPAPYVISTKSKVVKAGNPLEITISGKRPENTIKGLMLQARVGEEPVGTFKLASNENLVQLIKCSNPGDTVTHKKHDEKEDKQSVTLTWIPPTDLSDEVKFRATVALNGAVFWVGIESAPIKVSQ